MDLRNPEILQALMRAVYHAGRWLDHEHNKPLAVEILGRSEPLNLAQELIEPALMGQLTLSLGGQTNAGRPVFRVSPQRGIVPKAHPGRVDCASVGC